MKGSDLVCVAAGILFVLALAIVFGWAVTPNGPHSNKDSNPSTVQLVYQDKDALCYEAHAGSKFSCVARTK